MEYSIVRVGIVTIDAQKEALYAEMTRRASLYTRMFALQRSGAPAEEIDQIIAQIGISEAETRRMSDEVNDRIWYQNYGQVVRLLEQEVEGHSRSLALLEENSAAIKKAEQAIDEIRGVMSDYGETLSETNTRVDDLAGRMDAVEYRLTTVETTLEALAGEVGATKASVDMLQNLTDEPPPAIKKRMQ